MSQTLIAFNVATTKRKELSQKLVRIHTHYVYQQMHSSWVTGFALHLVRATGFDLGGSLGDQNV